MENRFPHRALSQWYAKNRRVLPWRVNPSPYRVWISEIMLQQTQVKDAVPYYERFVKRFPDVAALARADEGDVLSLWSGLGYYARARNLQKSARRIVTEFHGTFPQEPEQLATLPGIGRYTAGAVSSIAFNRPAAILDGNVRRVLSRCFLERSEESLWLLSGRLVRRSLKISVPPSDFNQSLMELGALVCKTKAPLCRECPLKNGCQARRTNRQDEFPATKKKAETQRISIVMAVISPRTYKKNSAARFLIQKRGNGQRWLKGLWELPTVEADSRGAGLTGLSSRFSGPSGVPVRLTRLAGTFAHRITSHILRVQVVEGCANARIADNGARVWTSGKELSRYPVSSMVHKALALAGKI